MGKVKIEGITYSIENEAKAVCFSGHRPEKLPFIEKGNTFSRAAFLSVFQMKILECLEYGHRIFYVGMSRGVDLWAGSILADQKMIILI